ASHNKPELEGQQWKPSYGVVSASYGGSSTIPRAVAAEVVLAADAGAGGWAAKSITVMNGLSIDGSSIVYTPPSTTPTWNANGLWSRNDTPSLSKEIAQSIATGDVYLLIVDAQNPQGVLRGALTPDGVDPETQLLRLSVKFAPVGRSSSAAGASASFTL